MENITIKEHDNSEVEITASIATDEYEAYRPEAIKHLGKNIEVDGFRKGHVPEDVLVQKIGEGVILHEMAEIAIAEAYPKIITEKKIAAIGRPEITITKMAPGNPLEFTAKTAVMPEVELPDYKAIAAEVMKEKEEIVVTDDEVEKTILEIRTNWAHQMQEMKKKVEDAAKKDDKESEEKPEEKKEAEKPELPELTDDFVKQLGEFKDIADFKAKLKSNIADEKKAKGMEKKRLTMMDKIIEKATVNPPQLLVNAELDRMMTQFKDNVAMMGQKPEEYFAQIKKSEEEVRKGWEADGIKRVKTQLALHKIAEDEKIEVPEDKLKKEVERIMQQYPGAEENRARSYVENLMMNEETFVFLEKQV